MMCFRRLLEYPTHPRKKGLNNQSIGFPLLSTLGRGPISPNNLLDNYG